MIEREIQGQLAAYLSRFDTFAAPPLAVHVAGRRGRRLSLFATVALVAVVVALLAVPILLAIQSRHATPVVRPQPTPIISPPPPLHHNGQVVLGFADTLVALDVANGVEHPLFTALADEVITAPAYSPDGTRIAYLGGHDGFGAIDSIWVLDTRTGHTHQLTTCALCDTNDSLSWSPDGSRLAYSETDPSGSLQLHVIDADGTHETQLTHFPAAENAYQPSWSPDGAHIAFAYFSIGNSPIEGKIVVTVDLDVIRSDGTGLAMLLTATNGPNDPRTTLLFPAWSPDGSRIAYVLDPSQPGVVGEGQYQMWVADADGSHRAEIFHADGCCRGGGSFAGPAWSPDGTRIATQVLGTFWLINPDGSAPKSLGELSGDRPAWQPVP